ncbi:MAG: hypothetical protein QXL16_00825 [Candidatus Micrarchaeaceae archaeon]
MLDENKFESNTFLYVVNYRYKEEIGFSLLDFLNDPSSFLGNERIGSGVRKYLEKIDSMLDEILSNMKEEKEKFFSDMEKVDAYRKMLDEKISSFSSSHNKIFMRNAYVNSREQLLEIYVQAEEQTSQLFDKLLNGSDIILDLSYNISDFKVGSWAFIGSAFRIIATLSLPQSPVAFSYMDAEEAKSAIRDAASLIGLAL